MTQLRASKKNEKNNNRKKKKDYHPESAFL